MNAPPSDRGRDARLVAMTVADDAAGWEAAGFTAVEGSIRLGTTMIDVIGGKDTTNRSGAGLTNTARHGIRGWTVAGLDLAAGGHLLDGLVTTSVDTDEPPDAEQPTAEAPGPPPHPNGVTGIDHVVVSTPDLERTIVAFEALGLGCRRIREAGTSDAPFRQAFFRVGSVIVEVVGAVEGSGQPAAEAPSTWFGLALDVDDLDATAALLGPALGRVKAAVQPDRRIATLRRREVGMATSVAFMDRHGGR